MGEHIKEVALETELVRMMPRDRVGGYQEQFRRFLLDQVTQFPVPFTHPSIRVAEVGNPSERIVVL